MYLIIMDYQGWEGLEMTLMEPPPIFEALATLLPNGGLSEVP